MDPDNGSLDEVIKPREQGSEKSWISRNAVEIGRSYKSQALASLGAVTGSLPGFIVVAGLMSIFTSVGGSGFEGWNIVLVPYGVTVAILTVSSSSFFSQFSIVWHNVGQAVSQGSRGKGTSNRPIYEILMLHTVGLTFLTLLSLGVSLVTWVILASIAPVIGPYVAATVAISILLYERWLVNEREKSITATGVNIGKWIIENTSELSPHHRRVLNNEAELTKKLMAATVGGRSRF